MTTIIIPDFINSKYFILEPGNWHLTNDAPEKIIKEFNKWLAEYERNKPLKNKDKND